MTTPGQSRPDVSSSSRCRRNLSVRRCSWQLPPSVTRRSVDYDCCTTSSQHNDWFARSVHGNQFNPLSNSFLSMYVCKKKQREQLGFRATDGTDRRRTNCARRTNYKPKRSMRRVSSVAPKVLPSVHTALNKPSNCTAYLTEYFPSLHPENRSVSASTSAATTRYWQRGRS